MTLTAERALASPSKNMSIRSPQMGQSMPTASDGARSCCGGALSAGAPSAASRVFPAAC